MYLFSLALVQRERAAVPRASLEFNYSVNVFSCPPLLLPVHQLQCPMQRRHLGLTTPDRYLIPAYFFLLDSSNGAAYETISSSTLNQANKCTPHTALSQPSEDSTEAVERANEITCYNLGFRTSNGQKLVSAK